jgi:3-oxoacyl-[acyl-carrier-protein] synthase-3
MSIAALTRGVVLGTGMAVPERVMTNADLEKIVDTTDEWITTRTGIKERRVCAPGQNTRDLAAEAGKKALEEAEVDPDEVDVVIVSTATPDHLLPSTACEVQPLLGCYHAACFDISAACAGWLYALTLADGLLATRLYRNVLVIGAEKMSAIIDYTDRATCVIFGDGAGAALICPPGSGEYGSGILASHMQTDGRQAAMLWRPAGGAAMPSSDQTRAERLEYVKQEGREVFKGAVLAMEESSRITLERARLSLDDIDLVIPHQANIRIIHAFGARLGVPDDKVYINIHRYGNTSSASIPICLAEASAEGRVGPGSTILMTAFGGGFAWGSVVLRL